VKSTFLFLDELEDVEVTGTKEDTRQELEDVRCCLHCRLLQSRLTEEAVRMVTLSPIEKHEGKWAHLGCEQVLIQEPTLSPLQ